MTGRLDYMLSFPAYGAIVGGWFGAFPMPLDWERAWQVKHCNYFLTLDFFSYEESN